jgi:nitroreductase
VLALLEAARWAPSANNNQPWRFLVGHRGDDVFGSLLAVLAPGNRSWAHAASALILVAAQTVDGTGRPRPWALFDTGQAVAALSVQAEADGLSVHQMGGFDADAARDVRPRRRSGPPFIARTISSVHLCASTSSARREGDPIR